MSETRRPTRGRAAISAVLLMLTSSAAAEAAASRNCEGGGVTVRGAGFSVGTEGEFTVPAGSLGDTIRVNGQALQLGFSFPVTAAVRLQPELP